MIILGIDPGLKNTGYAIVSIKNEKIDIICGGCIETEKGERRLFKIYNILSNIIECYKPNIAVLENTFVNINPGTSLSLGQARGACLLAIERFNIKLIEISTTQIRKRISGKGNTTKEEIQKIIQQNFAIPNNNNISDAIAAILGIFSIKINNNQIEQIEIKI